MNIAFTTVLIFVLLSPGFLYRIAYNSSKISVRNPNKNILNELTWSIIPSLTIHIICISLVEYFSDFYVDFEQLGTLLLGVTSENKVDVVFSQLGNFIYPIFFYNISVLTISFLAGIGMQFFIRHFKWDRKYRYFRFSNKWHYIFSGECLDFPDVPDKFDEITDKIINVLCKANDKTILYIGEFFDYYIDSSGDLEAVHLKYPVRRYLNDEIDKTKTYYNIPSRYLVIPSKDIININFRYFKREEVDAIDLTPEELKNLLDFDTESKT